MREIRKINPEEVVDYTEITFMAYPVKDFSRESIEAYEKNVLDALENNDIVKYYGVFDHGKMVGCMRLFDFEMNYFNKMIPVLGLGFIAVHTVHKKEGVARSMVEYYEKQALERGMPIATLLPFRPDFYKSMGYGIGTKMNQYRIQPKYIPSYDGKADLRHVHSDEDFDLLTGCHNRMVEKTHGMVRKFDDVIKDIKDDPQTHVLASFREDGSVDAYIAYEFHNTKADNHYALEIYIKEFTYDSIDGMNKILGFLRNQADQVQIVVFNTKDENFHYLIDNPLNDSWNYIPAGNLETNTQALGTMYRLLDIEAAFKQVQHRNFNKLNMDLRLITVDEYTGEETETIINFVDGKAEFNNRNYDVSIRTGGSDFSALFMGSTTILGLYNLGLLEIDDESKIYELDRAFYSPVKPISNVNF